MNNQLKKISELQQTLAKKTQELDLFREEKNKILNKFF